MIRKKVADEIFEVRFLPSGKLFGIVRVADRYRFVYWSLPNFEEELIYETPPQAKTAKVFACISVARNVSPDMLAVAFQTSRLSFRIVIRGQEALLFSETESATIPYIDISPNGERVIVKDDGQLRFLVWEEAAFRACSQVQVSNRQHYLMMGFFVCLGFLSDSEHYLLWDYECERISILNFRTHEEVNFLELPDGFVACGRWSADGEAVVLMSQSLLYLDLADWHSELELELLSPQKPIDWANHWALHPNKDRIMNSKETRPFVHVYSRTTQSVTETFNWARQTICGLDYSYDGLLASSGTINGEIIVWDVDS